MISSRWRKVLRDIWQNKGRSLLVILSISIGVLAVGTVVQMREIVQTDMVGSYEISRPAHAVVYTNETFDDDLLEVIAEMPGVAAVQGRASVVMRFQLGPDQEWYPVQFIARSDYENMEIDILHEEPWFEPESEAWPGPVPLPPPDREVMWERTSLLRPIHGLQYKAKLGDTMLVETPLGRTREMRMAGLVGDFARMPATWGLTANGFVTFETLEWMGASSDYNQLAIRVIGDGSDKAHNQAIADLVADRIERSNVSVAHVQVPDPGKLPLDSLVDRLVFLLGAMGGLALGASVFLLISTMQSMLTQQVRQIGVMKALGARGRDITVMYMSIIVLYGLLALLIAVPTGTIVARRVLSFLVYFINFRMGDASVSPRVLIIEAALALLVPLLAGLWPILSGVRITVREAISDYGLGEGQAGDGWIDRLLERVRGLPRPLLLSLRNTFRRKGRLVLTLITLVLAGTIFMAIVSVRASMTATVDEVLEFFKSDATLFLNRPYRFDRIKSVALSVPGVVAVEGWGSASTYRLRPDGSDGTVFEIDAPPSDSTMIEPTMVEGRWLLPEDKNAIVLNTDLSQDEPDVRVGDTMVLDIHDRETEWTVVGIMRSPVPYAMAYANYDYLSRLTRSVGRVGLVRVVTEKHDERYQEQVAEALSERLTEEGLSVLAYVTLAGQRANFAVLFNILIQFLYSMALLMAIVGGISLMGTMLLNVLERIREVGVMRAIGARTDAVLQIFIVEGAIIGLLSWVIAVILAWPLGKIVSSTVGEPLLGFPLKYSFSLTGVGIWLAAAVLLSAASSYFPAQNAARLTVREVLAYDG